METHRHTFGEVLEALRMGKTANRLGWNEGYRFIFLVQGSRFTTNREPLNSVLGEGVDVVYRPHIDIKETDGSIGVWTCSQEDMLAEDWIIRD